MKNDQELIVKKSALFRGVAVVVLALKKFSCDFYKINARRLDAQFRIGQAGCSGA